MHGKKNHSDHNTHSGAFVEGATPLKTSPELRAVCCFLHLQHGQSKGLLTDEFHTHCLRPVKVKFVMMGGSVPSSAPSNHSQVQSKWLQTVLSSSIQFW